MVHSAPNPESNATIGAEAWKLRPCEEFDGREVVSWGDIEVHAGQLFSSGGTCPKFLRLWKS